MGLFEMEVSRKSFWAKYEGSNTCNAKAVYVLIALLALAAVGLVATFVWGLVVDPVNTFIITVMAVLSLGSFYLLCFTDPDAPVQFFDRHPTMTKIVSRFFIWGFVWLWAPVLLIVICVNFLLCNLSSTS